jgi:hypothetical protein
MVTAVTMATPKEPSEQATPVIVTISSIPIHIAFIRCSVRDVPFISASCYANWRASCSRYIVTADRPITYLYLPGSTIIFPN